MPPKKKIKKAKNPPLKKKLSVKRPLKKKIPVKAKGGPQVKKVVKLKVKTAKKNLKARLVIKKKASAGAPLGRVLGEIAHYFPHVNAAVVKVKESIKTGDSIRIKGHTTDFTEEIASMQIDHNPILEAKPGDEIGLKVGNRVRIGDTVYRV